MESTVVGGVARCVSHQVSLIYRRLGFCQGYAFLFWIVLSGALVGFVLARIRYLDIDNVFCAQRGAALPGECFYLGHGKGKIGIQLHLTGIMPAALLAVLQLLPVFRRNMLLFHRINGYIILMLSLVSCIGILMMTRQHFGGGLNSQAVTGAALVMFIMSLSLAYYNVKRLRIDQHRAWMLRAWVVVSVEQNFAFCFCLTVNMLLNHQASHVITMRLMAKLMIQVTAAPSNHYYDYRSCAVIDFMFGNNATLVEFLYPDCMRFYSGANVEQRVLIAADLTSGRPDHIAAGLNVAFGPAAWLALLLHCIAAEVYLNMTPDEARRLRALSRERQLEASNQRSGSPSSFIDTTEKAQVWGQCSMESSTRVHVSSSGDTCG
jgi:hypothetical protein